MTDPRATPAVMTLDHSPIAVARWPGSVNIVRTRAMVDGMRVAPPTPSRARAAINVPAESAYAASREAAPNATAPNSSSRRRPIRSPRDPMVMRSPARTNA